jgi:hypothetical protein
LTRLKSRFSLSRLLPRTQRRSVSAVQPIFAAMAPIAAHGGV